MGAKDLLHAIVNEDVELTRKIVEQIHSKGHISKKLLYKDSNGFTVLHRAALCRKPEIISLVLCVFNDVECLDGTGDRPIHLAAWAGHTDCLLELIQRNAQINAVSKARGETALHLAAMHGHIRAVEALLKFGADPTLPSLSFKTPVDLAAEFGRLCVVEAFLKVPRVIATLNVEHDVDSANYESPLHLAARNGHVDVVSALLNAGFDINKETSRGTALHEAAISGKIDTVRFLIESGINVKATNTSGATALDLVTTLKSKDGFAHIRQVLLRALGQTSAHPASSLRLERHSSPFGVPSIKTDFIVNEYPSLKRPNSDGNGSTSKPFIPCTFLPSERLNLSPEIEEISMQSLNDITQTLVELNGPVANVARAYNILKPFLARYSLEEYVGSLIDNGYDYATLLHMNNADLAAVGISNPRDRLRLSEVIQSHGPSSVLINFVPESVHDFLTAIDLLQYETLFENAGMKTMASFKECNIEDIMDIGITKLGHQKRLLVGISQLNYLSKLQPTEMPLPIDDNYEDELSKALEMSLERNSTFRAIDDSIPQFTAQEHNSDDDLSTRTYSPVLMERQFSKERPLSVVSCASKDSKSSSSGSGGERSSFTSNETLTELQFGMDDCRNPNRNLNSLDTSHIRHASSLSNSDSGSEHKHDPFEHIVVTPGASLKRNKKPSAAHVSIDPFTSQPVLQSPIAKNSLSFQPSFLTPISPRAIPNSIFKPASPPPFSSSFKLPRSPLVDPEPPIINHKGKMSSCNSSSSLTTESSDGDCEDLLPPPPAPLAIETGRMPSNNHELLKMLNGSLNNSPNSHFTDSSPQNGRLYRSPPEIPRRKESLAEDSFGFRAS